VHAGCMLGTVYLQHSF